MLPPERVVENGDVCRALCGFACEECASVLRLHAERLEEIPVGHNSCKGQGFTAAGERVSARSEKWHVGGDLLERAILFGVFVVNINLVGEGRKAAEAAIGIEPGQFVRIGERKRTQQKRIDDAEDGNVCADAESENQNS